MVILSDESSLEQSPETLNSVGVYILSYVLTFFVIYVLVFEAVFYCVIPPPFVRDDSGTGFYVLLDEREECAGISSGLGLRYDLSPALQDAHDRYLVLVTTPLAAADFFIIVSVSVLATHVRLIRLYYSPEEFSVFAHCLPDLHENAPGGVLVDVYIPSELTRGYALFGVNNERYCVKPFLEWKLCVVEDSPDCDRERFIARPAVIPVFALNPCDFL